MINYTYFFDIFKAKDAEDCEKRLGFFVFNCLNPREHLENNMNDDVKNKEEKRSQEELNPLIDQILFLQDKILHQYEGVRVSFIPCLKDEQEVITYGKESMVYFLDLLRLIQCLEEGIHELTHGKRFGQDESINDWIESMKELCRELSLI